MAQSRLNLFRLAYRYAPQRKRLLTFKELDLPDQREVWDPRDLRGLLAKPGLLGQRGLRALHRL